MLPNLRAFDATDAEDPEASEVMFTFYQRFAGDSDRAWPELPDAYVRSLSVRQLVRLATVDPYAAEFAYEWLRGRTGETAQLIDEMCEVMHWYADCVAGMFFLELVTEHGPAAASASDALLEILPPARGRR